MEMNVNEATKEGGGFTLPSSTPLPGPATEPGEASSNIINMLNATESDFLNMFSEMGESNPDFGLNPDFDVGVENFPVFDLTSANLDAPAIGSSLVGLNSPQLSNLTSSEADIAIGIPRNTSDMGLPISTDSEAASRELINIRHEVSNENRDLSTPPNPQLELCPTEQLSTFHNKEDSQISQDTRESSVDNTTESITSDCDVKSLNEGLISEAEKLSQHQATDEEMTGDANVDEDMDTKESVDDDDALTSNNDGCDHEETSQTPIGLKNEEDSDSDDTIINDADVAQIKDVENQTIPAVAVTLENTPSMKLLSNESIFK